MNETAKRSRTHDIAIVTPDYAAVCGNFWRAVWYNPRHVQSWTHVLVTSFPFRKRLVPILRAMIAGHDG
jgi:hypothetical protein